MAQDLAGSKDLPGTKRYAGSETIGYRAPKFDEYELPLLNGHNYKTAGVERGGLVPKIETTS